MNIEFDQDLTFGEDKVTSIEVTPLSFRQTLELHNQLPDVDAAKALQRMRIKAQTVFKAGRKVVVPGLDDLYHAPASIMKKVIDQLDADNGPRGTIVSQGDGVTSPIIYKLGTPIKLQRKAKEGESDNEEMEISELEFLASTFGELEDVLASPNDMNKTMALVETVAKPLGVSTLSRLPQWAVDKITVGDGVGLMALVTPAF